MKKIALAALVVGLIGGCSTGMSSSTFPPLEAGVVDAASDAHVQDAVAEDSPPDVQDAGGVVMQIPDGGFESGALDLGYAETLPIGYLGGPVLTNPINVYFIWYGNWTDTNTQPILEDLMKGMGASQWFAITEQYYQQPTDIIPDAGEYFGGDNKPHKVHSVRHTGAAIDAGVAVDSGTTDSGDGGYPPVPYGMVSSTVNFVKSVKVGSPLGDSLQDTDIPNIVATATGNGAGGVLPFDVNGVYFVLTSAEVSESGDYGSFCGSYCGWHENATIAGQTMHVAFVGDTGSCPEGCSLQTEYASYGVLNSPNGDWSGDSMASVVSHELSESATDPEVITDVAWLDEYGYEVADKCAWTFGQPYITSSGSIANVKIGSRDFMIQQDWVLDSDAGQHCDLHP